MEHQVLTKATPIRCKVGRGVWPYGHTAEDAEAYAGLSHHLAYWIPANLCHNDDTTTRRLKYAPDSQDHDATRAHVILSDLFRAYAENRMVGRPEAKAESRKRKRTNSSTLALKREAPFRDMAVPTVYTTLQVPRGSVNQSDSDPYLRKVWCHPDSYPGGPDGTTTSSYSLDEDVGGLSSGSTTSSSSSSSTGSQARMTTCSSILGDPDTGADANCAQYINASFAGRLEELSIDDVGDFNNFCQQYIIENNRMYYSDTVRENKIKIMLGRVGHDKQNNIMESTTETESSWLRKLDTNIAPSECILSMEDFCHFAQIIDGNWAGLITQHKTNPMIFSTFFSLQKQLNLMARQDIPDAFKQLSNYVYSDNMGDLAGQRVLTVWPALRKRYRSEETCWADSQRTPVPHPGDIAAFPTDQFKAYYQTLRAGAAIRLTDAERDLDIAGTSYRNDLDADHEDNRLMMTEQQARRMYVSTVGIGRSVETIDDNVLKERNTSALKAIRAEFAAKRAALAARQPSDARGRMLHEKKMDRLVYEEKTEILLYKRYAANEVARTVFHANGNTSDENRAAAAHLKKMLTEFQSVCIMVPKHSTNLTLIGDMWTYLGLVFDMVMDVCYTHDLLPVLLASGWDSSDPQKGLKPNIIQTGDNETGKSFNFEVVCKMLVEHMVDMVSDSTKNAHKENKSRNAKIEVHEEANDAWFGVVKGRAGTTPELQALKARLTSNVVISDHGWIDKETGGRINIRTTTACKNVLWINSNRIDKYAAAALSRFLVFSVPKRHRPGHNVSDMSPDTNIDRSLMQSAVLKLLSFIHSLIAATFMLIGCGVIDQVATPVTEKLWNKVLKEWQERYADRSTIIRPYEMFRGIVRAVTIARALLIRFCSPDSVYYRYKFRSVADLLEALVTLECDLVDADPTICVHMLGLIPMVRNRFDVIEALIQLFFKVSPWCKNPNANGLKALVFEKHGLAAAEEARRKAERNRERRGEAVFAGPARDLSLVPTQEISSLMSQMSMADQNASLGMTAAEQASILRQARHSQHDHHPSQHHFTPPRSQQQPPPPPPPPHPRSQPPLQSPAPTRRVAALPLPPTKALMNPRGGGSAKPTNTIAATAAALSAPPASRSTTSVSSASSTRSTVPTTVPMDITSTTSTSRATAPTPTTAPLAKATPTATTPRTTPATPMATTAPPAKATPPARATPTAGPRKPKYPNPRACPELCRCDKCTEYRMDYIETEEGELNYNSDRTDYKDDVSRETEVRQLQYQQNMRLRQLRYLQLYSCISDEDGVNIATMMANQRTDDAQLATLHSNAMTPQQHQFFMQQQHDDIEREVSLLARDEIEMGVYYIAHDALGLSRHTDANGGAVVLKPKAQLKRLVSLVYAFMVTHSASAPSRHEVHTQLEALMNSSVKAYHARYPKAVDSGLGHTPSNPTASEKHTIKALRFLDNGDLQLACHVALNNCVDPLRCIVQDTLEYDFAVPRSYPFGTHSEKTPYLYSTINVIPNPKKPFRVLSAQEYPKVMHQTMQVLISGFSDMEPQRKVTQNEFSFMTEEEKKYMTENELQEPVRKPQVPSVEKAFAQFQSELLDRPLEDAAYMAHTLSKGWTMDRCVLLGSATEQTMCARRIELQEKHLLKRRNDPADSEFKAIQEFKVASYPQHLLHCIREAEAKREAELEAQRKGILEPGETKNAAIPTTLDHMYKQYRQKDVDMFLNGQSFTSLPVLPPVPPTSPATSTISTASTTSASASTRGASSSASAMDDAPPVRPLSRPVMRPMPVQPVTNSVLFPASASTESKRNEWAWQQRPKTPAHPPTTFHKNVPPPPPLESPDAQMDLSTDEIYGDPHESKKNRDDDQKHPERKSDSALHSNPNRFRLARRR